MFFIWLYGRYWMHLNRKYLQRHKKKTIQCRWSKETCSRLSVQILVSVTSFSIYCTLYCQNFFRVSNISDLPKTKAIFVGLDKKKIDAPVSISAGLNYLKRHYSSYFWFCFYQGYFSQEKTHYTKSSKCPHLYSLHYGHTLCFCWLCCKMRSR